MKMNKIMLAASFTLGMAVASSASAVSVGGITWDETSVLDFSSSGSITETDVGAIGDQLDIWGNIQLINGTGTFLTGASELTFSGSYIVKDVGDFDGDGNVDIVFDTGSVTFYADQDAADFNTLSQASATDGLVWLTIDAQDTTHDYGGGVTKLGDLFAELNAGLAFGDLGDAGAGFGAFDVTGGLAAAFLDTDSITNLAGQALDNGTADLTFTNSFQPSQVEGLLIASGELLGQTAVPEPSSILLLGLGVFGLGLSGMRKFKRS